MVVVVVLVVASVVVDMEVGRPLMMITLLVVSTDVLEFLWN
jgi:hypothetical protein